MYKRQQPGSGFVPTAYDRREIAIIAYEGWEKSAKTAADYVATQFMIWEAVGGRITRTNFSDYGAYKAVSYAHLDVYKRQRQSCWIKA